jgi:hypothetical protein
MAKAGVSDKWADGSVARHTHFSFARANSDFEKLSEDNWCRKAGHTAKVFSRYYSAPMVPAEAKEFFSILPPKI